MKKSLQKGFSLVELLVVVAIIGVLAGVGIVGYQSYTESAKVKVAEANFNSITRFIETELTLWNNGVQDSSGAIFEQDRGAAAPTAIGTTAFTRNTHSILALKGAIEFHFGMASEGLKFKNPFAVGTSPQLRSLSGTGTGAAADYCRGFALLRQTQPGEDGIGAAGAAATDAALIGKLSVVYTAIAQVPCAVPTAAELTAGLAATPALYKQAFFELK